MELFFHLSTYYEIDCDDELTGHFVTSGFCSGTFQKRPQKLSNIRRPFLEWQK